MAGVISILAGMWLTLWGFRTAAISRNTMRRTAASILGPIGILMVGTGAYLLV